MEIPLLGFLAGMDGLRGEMLEARQETVWGGVFFLHAELRRRKRWRVGSEKYLTRNPNVGTGEKQKK